MSNQRQGPPRGGKIPRAPGAEAPDDTRAADARPGHDDHDAPHDHDHHDHQHGGKHDHAHAHGSPGAAAAKHPESHVHAHEYAHERGHHRSGGHDHAAELRGISEAKLRAALLLTVGFMFVELAFGLYSRSIALVSDAGHMLADAGALTLALIAQRFAARPATPRRTYGFRRAEILAAFLNGVALVFTAFYVLNVAWERWSHPAVIRGDVVTVVALLGLGVNVVTAWILARGAGHNLNTRAALFHVATDAVGSVIATTAGMLAWRFGWMRADPALSVLMAALLLFGAWAILKRAVVILMEGTPAGLDLERLEATIRHTPGVAAVHDLHAWTISEGFDVVTVHVVLDGTQHGTDVARVVGERIHAIHRVAHVTVQPEAPRQVELRPPRSLLQRPN